MVIFCGIAVGQVTLENFSSIRTAPDGTPLWLPWTDAIDGAYTNCQSPTNNTWTCSAAPQGAGPVPNGIAVWFYTRDVSGYSYPKSYLKSWITNGTWSPSLNRLRFRYYCDTSVPGPPANTKGNMEIGTYVRSPNDPNASNSGQGTHYYHYLGANVYANRWIYGELNRVPDHRVSNFQIPYPEDPEYVIPLGGYPAHYWDGMTHFYWRAAYIDDQAHYLNSTCHLADFTLDTVIGGADNWVHSIASTYNGSAYEIHWQAPKLVAPMSVPTTYDIRYSASSLRSRGFSTGTSAGSITSPGGYTLTEFTSAMMSEAPGGIYFGIRPHMPLLAVTNTAPIVIQATADHNIASGDQVVIAGVAGNTAANGTWSVTVIPATGFGVAAGTLKNIVVANSVGTVTTSAPHGLLAGQAVVINVSANQDLDQYGKPYIVQNVPSATTFTIVAPVISRTYDSSNSPQMILFAPAAVSLTGSDGTQSAAYIAGSGTMTATSEISNFAEVFIPTLPTTAGISRCDLNGDNAVNVLDVSTAATHVLNGQPCSVVLSGLGPCTVMALQKLVMAVLNGVCSL